MTEQQIERLREVLNSAQAPNSPAGLDEQIVAAARARNTTKSKRRFLRLLIAFTPSAFTPNAFTPSAFTPNAFTLNPRAFGFMRSAALAVLLTVVMLFGMSRVLSPTQVAQLAVPKEQQELRIHGNSAREDQPVVVLPVARPDEIAVAPPVTQSVKDQILADVELPDTDTLLASMDLSLSSDRDALTRDISLAMQEIRYMLQEGEFNGARARYARLKDVCRDCALPETLEALIINSS